MVCCKVSRASDQFPAIREDTRASLIEIQFSSGDYCMYLSDGRLGVASLQPVDPEGHKALPAMSTGAARDGRCTMKFHKNRQVAIPLAIDDARFSREGEETEEER